MWMRGCRHVSQHNSGICTSCWCTSISTGICLNTTINQTVRKQRKVWQQNENESWTWSSVWNVVMPFLICTDVHILISRWREHPLWWQLMNDNFEAIVERIILKHSRSLEPELYLDWEVWRQFRSWLLSVLEASPKEFPVGPIVQRTQRTCRRSNWRTCKLQNDM